MKTNSDSTVNSRIEEVESKKRVNVFTVTQTFDFDLMTIEREVRVDGHLKYKDHIWYKWWRCESRPKTIIDDFIQQFNPTLGTKPLNQRKESRDTSYNRSYFFSLFGKRWFNFLNLKKKVLD